MEGTWDVLENGEKVGACTVTAEGLYLRIRCVCKRRPGIVRLYWDGVPLGIPVPQGEGLVLETRQAKKRFLGLEPRFFLGEPQKKTDELFVPLRPEEPFSYLERLSGARFVRQGGEPGLQLFIKSSEKLVDI